MVGGRARAGGGFSRVESVSEVVAHALLSLDSDG